MWIIIGLVILLGLLIIASLCKVSGRCSRLEEEIEDRWL